MALACRLLGPTEVVIDGEPLLGGGAQERAVLAMLALGRCTSLTPEQLIERAWPAGDGTRGSLHVHVHNVRRRLGRYADHLTSGPAGYRLGGPDLWLDIDRVGELALLLADARAGNDQRGVIALAKEAEALFRGELCADLPELELAAERQSFAEQRLMIVEQRIEAELRTGRDDSLVELEALVAEHPFRERMWGLLMVALHQAQRQTEALAAYRRARSTLLDEVGVEPGQLLRALERAILAQQDPMELLGSAQSPVTGPALIWLDERGSPRRCPLPAHGQLVIGRAAGAQVRLVDDDTVSRRHAAIERRGSAWELTDLASMNGTMLNGAPVAERKPLATGDLIRCGRTTLLLAAPTVLRLDDDSSPRRTDRATQQLR